VSADDSDVVAPVTLGGVVVHSAFETVSFSYLQGRWLSGNYSPYSAPVGGISQNDFLGTYNPAHPLMQGVGITRSRQCSLLAPRVLLTITSTALW
jgi:hypothetical protein